MGNILHKFNAFTPNYFTLCSLIITLFGIYNIYHQNYKLGGVLYFIGYFFDCLDGNFARKYKMVTNFGDRLDHYCDILKFGLLIFIIYTSNNIPQNIKKIFIISCIIGSILALIHFGCQERFYNLKSVLTPLKKLCPNKKNIHLTKYLGSGTLYLFKSLFIFNMGFIISKYGIN